VAHVTDPVTVTPDDGYPYLAVDLQPDDAAGVFVLDVSELDGPDVLALGTAADQWLNVVCTVLSVDYQRGAGQLAGALTTTEAGQLTVVLEDDAGMFDPLTNRDLVHKGTPVRVRAWSTDDGTGAGWQVNLFTGQLDDVALEYQRDAAPVVTLAVSDLIGPVAGWQTEGGPGVGAGDTLLQRVNRVLALLNRPAAATDSDSDYSATLAPAAMAKPWQELQAATEAELGRLWVSAAGDMVVRARGSELAGPVRGTLSDVHGDAPVGVHCCLAAAGVRYSAETMANRVLAQRRLPAGDAGPATLTRLDDEPSQARYGVGTVDRRSLELATDAQVTAWAQAVITGHTTPRLRIDQVTPQPPADDLDTALAAWPAVCGTDLGDRWLFRYHTFGGQLVERTVGVLGISATLTPDAWTITWLTADAPASGSTLTGGWFVLDVSELDGADLLAPYAVRAG
jgi:hypothetical protein